MPRNAYTFCIACAIMISCGMKRSVRKNKRQQQAAGCSMDKKHRNSEETYEKSVERHERQKMRRDRRRKKHENKYTARHQLLRLPILVLLAAAGMFAPKLLSSCPQQTERIYSRAIYPVISRVFSRHASCGNTRCAAVQTRVFKTPETETQSNALLQLPDFAWDVCGRNAESFLCILGNKSLQNARCCAFGIFG